MIRESAPELSKRVDLLTDIVGKLESSFRLFLERFEHDHQFKRQVLKALHKGAK